MIELKNNPAGNFFLLAGPCVIEGEEMAMRIAERIVTITEKLQLPYVFKGSYRKANRSRLDSFMDVLCSVHCHALVLRDALLPGRRHGRLSYR